MVVRHGQAGPPHQEPPGSCRYATRASGCGRRGFARDVVGNAEAAAIAKVIAMLGSSLNMAITAEGVEEAEQLQKLRELGCDEAQGYYLSRPRSAGARWRPCCSQTGA